MRHLAIFLLIATTTFAVEFVCHYDQFLHSGIPHIESSITWPITIISFNFQADSAFTKTECEYLTGFKEGLTLDKANFEKGIGRLFSTKHFSFLCVRIEEGDLTIEAMGNWQLQKVHVTGFHFDKDVIKSLYLIEPGECFDYKKHLLSLAHIKKELSEMGYLDIQVTSDLSYDYDHKLASVSLSVDKGKRFRIAKHYISLQADECSKQDTQRIKQIIQKVTAPMEGGYWSYGGAVEKKEEIERALCEAGFFQHEVQFSKYIDRKAHKVDLSWQVVANAKRQFVFFGNAFFSDSDLLQQLLSLGSAISFLSENLLQQELVQFYKQKGFFNVHVDAHEEAHRIIFVIDERKRAAVQATEVTGVTVFTEKQIKYFFKKCVHRPFDYRVLERIFDQIKAKYRKQGYYHVVIDHYSKQLDDKNIVLNVTLKEGEPSLVTRTCVPGLPALEMHMQKKWPTAQPYTQELVAAQRLAIKEWCQKYSMLCGAITPRFDDTQLIWHLTTADAHFGKVIISGTDDTRIRRLIAFKEGDTWNEKAIQHSFKQLKRLNVFDTIQLVPGELGRERDITIVLRKDDPFELKVRAGLELQDIQKYQSISGLTYKLGGTFLIKDPFFAFDQLRFDANFTRVHREIVGRYDRPILSVPFLNMAIQLYSIKHDQPFVHTPDDIYTLKQHGGLLGFSYQGMHLDAGCNMGFEWMETEIDRDKKDLVASIARAIRFDPALLDHRVPFIFFEPVFIADYVDNHFDPQYGWLSMVTAKTMIPLNRQQETYFFKLLAEQTVYYPFSSVVGAFRLRFGHVFHTNFSAIMPNERFYLGGAFSLRSYDTDLAPPLGEFIDRKGNCVAVPQGGKSLVNANIEFRIPIINQFKLVLFQDLGFLSCSDFADVCFDSILVGTGFGLRYATPIGPVRFDLAFKWRNDIPNQQSFSWFLSIGQAF